MSVNKGAIGLDFGSSRTVVAVAKNKGVDVLINEASNRQTVNIVAYSDRERFLGEQGLAQQKSNFKNTCQFFNRIIGHKGKRGDEVNVELEEELKWMTTEMNEDEQGLMGYKVQYQQENYVFNSIQVTCSMLNKIKEMISKNNLDNQEMVITVPTYFTQQERIALLDACKVSEIKVQRLINESNCICLIYGIARRHELKDKNVIFVDVGHSKMSAFCAQFKSDKCSILAETHNRHLGARNMDWRTLQFYNDYFKNKHGLSFIKNKKCVLRMLDFIEKQRKVLSGNSEASINVECLMEEEDLNHVLSREEYIKIQEDVLQEMKKELIKLRDDLEKKLIKCDTVEIVGGCTRIPAVQQLIQEVLGVQQVHRTLDASECIARGASLQAAILSPFFNVPNYQVEELNYYNINCVWRFTEKDKLDEIQGNDNAEPNMNNDSQKQNVTLFKKNCLLPSTKSITVNNRSNNIEIVLFNNPSISGFDPLLARYLVKFQQPKEQDYNLKIKIRLNPNGIVEMDSVQLNEDYMEEKKIVVKNDKPVEKKDNNKMEEENKNNDNKDNKDNKMEEEVPQQKEEIQMVKKTRTTNMKYEGGLHNEQKKETIQKWFELESRMYNNDRVITEVYRKKNELESYVYELRQNIQGKYNDYSDQQTKNKIIELCDKNEDWLYNEGNDASKSAYQQRLDEMTKIGKPIQQRFQEYSTIPEYYQALQNAVNEANTLIQNQDPKYSHISLEERQQGQKQIQETSDWIQQSNQKVQQHDKLKDCPVTCQQVDDKINQLVNSIKQIMSKPVPPPPKKEEEKKSENSDKQQQSQEQQQNQQQNQEENIKMDVE